ncbi:phage antirepressor KilAC domain-containing protein [Ruminococcus sp.]|uniref:phage antirepressor KilAC domain-containing protein n=1 Tax=Ruminococcus sp. TaxID=41978 RepID=UPI001B568F1E|nr:phage antirepressor KilAC domain-containing protein [Ruminococcus sp.]MBP5431595.1 phage antirepressor KilAC domain-containing protein [Ruminococcus sp.]
MNDLININYDGSDRPTVMGRDLHEALEIKTQYSKWFDRMCEYGFTENSDFVAISQKRLTAQGNETAYTDHQLTIDMAKEICMIQRSDIGRKCRQYFIDVERQWNNPEAIMSRALKIADRKLLEARECVAALETRVTAQEQLIGELQPKADYTDSILNNKGLVTITQIAKDYGMSGKKMNKLLHEFGVQYKQSNQWFLYAKYQDKGYTHSKTIDIIRSDGRPDITMETKWTQKGRLFIYELLKNNGILPTIEQRRTS